MSVTRSDWLVVVTGRPTPLLSAALTAARREGQEPEVVPVEAGSWDWLLEAVNRLATRQIRLVLALDGRSLVGACLANKVRGVRAATVETLDDARRALRELGANCLFANPQGKTWFELRQLLRLAAETQARCPEEIAKVLEELEGHANR
ncbi:MAG: RpiB/LacA/LacB family sugar-phosphate isomerase [Gemmatales bacterium]|nr:RpiB/LacA/LacB family sugar-phosphate isomerase [Gemmatales bacterium]MDW8388045.1 hypothetical protein [Gemmatales bacterium]